MTYKKTTILLILFGFFLGMLFSYPPGFHSIDFSAWSDDYDLLFCFLNGGENCGSLSKFPLAYLVNSFLSSFFSIIFPFYFYAGALEFQSGVLLGIYSSSLFHCVIKKSKSMYFFVALFFSSLLIPLYKDTNIIFMGLVCFCIIFLELESRSIKSNELFNLKEIFRIFIYLPEVNFPKDLNISNDERELGIGLISLKFN